MKIVIMRHGKPALDLEKVKGKRMLSSGLGKIIAEYELSELNLSYAPSSSLIDIAKQCVLSISSDLPRSVVSSQLLGFEDTNIIDSCFRESDLPYLELNRPKLTFFTWAIIFRLAWVCGFSKNGESIKEARLRSGRGADTLEHFARKEGSVIHIGHGIMNRLLIRELKRRKWNVKEHTGEKYWSYTVLEYET